jgi:predicted GNAT superfamily acetyltransferase
MLLRPLSAADSEALWSINEEGLPGVGNVSQTELAKLVDLAELALGAFCEGQLVGFVICLPPRTAYSSLNYGWFNARYDEFLYVDRVAVAQAFRGRQVGTTLYQSVFAHAQRSSKPVAAEVNLHPPNPGSMRFHRRHGFAEVGTIDHGSCRVCTLLRSSSHD